MLSLNRTMMTMSEEKWQRPRRERLFEVLWSSLTRNYLKLLLSNSEEHWHATRNDSQYCNSPTCVELFRDYIAKLKYNHFSKERRLLSPIIQGRMSKAKHAQVMNVFQKLILNVRWAVYNHHLSEGKTSDTCESLFWKWTQHFSMRDPCMREIKKRI